MSRRTSSRGIVVAAAIVAAWAAPTSAPARVNPLHIIEQQIQKPNMLILFDTSGSMNLLPNAPDMDMHEAGMDCDNGDAYCRTVGKRNRCYMTMSGSLGPGRTNDTTSCTSNADCTKAGVCRAGGACFSNDDCADHTCGWVANNYCVLTPDPPTLPNIQMCQLSMNMCRQDSDCTLIAGDTCGPATSRLLVAKRVLKQVVQQNHDVINFGFMTFRQTGYYPYFKATTAVTTTTRTAFLTRSELEFAGCFTPSAGPSASCTINHTTYTLAATNNSRYKVNRGTYYSAHDTGWGGACKELCTITGVGTGSFAGSHYTFPYATAGAGTLKRFDDYVGRTRVDGVDTYVYLDAPRTKRNLNNIFGNEIDDDTAYGLSYTNASGIVDPNRVDLMDTSLALPLASAVTMARKISAQAEKVSLGGLYPYGGTPSGTALKASGVDAVKEKSAYHYLEWVKAQNTSNGVACRPNSVLFITDGRPGNGDVNCDHADCAASPPGPLCTCTAVLNARSIKQTLGATVYVIGFSGTLASVADIKSINNIAKAGGSSPYPAGCVGAACSYAYFATREADLRSALTTVIYDAARGNYSTSPASGSSGTQEINGITAGTILLDTRVDFPSWKGNVIAYDLSGPSPALAWSAATVAFNATADPTFWKRRNVWTSETVGSATYMIKIQVDQSTGAIVNKTKLTQLGLGATDAESELVARWMLGDPALGNPAVLGAMINSTPIDVGPPGTGSLPGAAAYFNGPEQKTRPFLTYVGSSDGMLHAFVTKSGKIGTGDYLGGQEAFAYIPQKMLKVINRLYVQGGQAPDPRDHIFGLASSPKVKTVCTSACTDAASATWKTVLTMTEGYGGNDLFVLDVSQPHTTTGIRDAINDPPVRRLEWHSDYLANTTQKGEYDARLGQTISVPALYLNNTTNLDDYRLLLASGYGDGVSAGQGKYLVSVNATTGEPLDWQQPTNVTTCANPGLEHALITDVAVSRRFDAGQNAQLASAYFGDPWGQLWRYTPKSSTKVSAAATFGCSHPLHFAPAVVQLDRDNAANRSGETYLVQVTNSALDPVTAYPGYPASKMVFTMDKRTGDDLASENFATGNAQITLNAGVGSEICAVTGAAGTCTTAMPANARPTGTPLAVLKEDGSGFQVISLWYVPGAGGCTKGITYLTIHELKLATAAVTQKYGGWLANEPVTSAAFVGNKLVFADATGAKDVSNYAGMPRFKPAPPGTFTSTERVRQVMWTEIP
jgi:hypothetical protein